MSAETDPSPDAETDPSPDAGKGPAHSAASATARPSLCEESPAGGCPRPAPEGQTNKPTAITTPYPFRDHPTMADVMAREGRDFHDGETTGERAAQLAERADMLAYLDRKIANAGRVIDGKHDPDGRAVIHRRAWEIIRDDIGGGLHEGESFLGLGASDAGPGAGPEGRA